MLDQETMDLLARAQELLGHTQCSRDVPQVLKRGLQLLVAQLEKRKFALTDRPRRSRSPGRNDRCIPAEVKRAVRERDGDRCTYVCPRTGKRCESRRVEFDHIVPIAKGGTSTISNLRLLCRPHNQLEAERAFGRDFMEAKRRKPSDREHILAALRTLGFGVREAGAAAVDVLELPVPLEEKVRRAIASLGRRRGCREFPSAGNVATRVGAAATGLGASVASA